MPYQIRLNKEDCKFSCAHFTVLSATRAEHLHGHNYYLGLELDFDSVDSELGMCIDFNSVKTWLREECRGLDERILLPGKSAMVEVKSQGGQTEVRFLERRYSFPEPETVVLPVSNVTSEELARWVAEKIAKKISAKLAEDAKKASNHKIPRLLRLAVEISETHGQSALYIVQM